MSTCTAQQIEEKKRQALAKLRAKQNGLSPKPFNPNQVPSCPSPHSAQQIEEKKRQALAKLRAKQNIFSPTKAPPPLLSNSTEYSEIKSVINRINYASSADMENKVSDKARSAGGKMASSIADDKHTFQPYQKLNRGPSELCNNFYGEVRVNITMSLVSEQMFTVEQSKYYEPLITVFKQIPSKVYDPEKKTWKFHLKDYESLLLKLQPLRKNVAMEIIPSYVVDYVLEKSLILSENIDLSPIDAPLLESLMPFQRDGVLFGIQKRGRCMIADEMGLGKTFQALALASYYKEDWPVLIVTTASMKNTWEETIHKYFTSIPVFYVKHMQGGKDYIQDTKILIVSHDLMTRYQSRLMERKFGILIIDESHTIKNFKAKCTIAAQSLSAKARRVILLTGTPALSRPSELYTQISLIDANFFRDFHQFSKRYCAGHQTRFGWNSSGQSNLQELEIILKKKFMIRRTKDEVLPDLPNKTRKVVKLDKSLLQFTKEELTNLNIMATNLTQSKKGGDRTAALLTFFSETAKLKVKAVCSYISDVIKEDKKCLIFVHHQIMLDKICELLEQKRIFHIRIDGKTSSDQRNFFVNRFNEDTNYKFAVLSITAANAGITLTSACLVLFGELHWNPSILTQAECRAHRIGQENTVEVQYLLAAGTADDYMWEMINSKTDVLNAVGLSKDTFKDTETTFQLAETKLSPSSQKSIKDYMKNDLTSSLTKTNNFDDSIFDDEEDDLFSSIDV